ncbi:hypothetical protein [Solibacillus sp. FSL W8-0372]|uniref:hypothetical protein n=1 Tax=Solibacillus sp. FSL W8-0372 TaxID=2921713 RepID=UPI0030CB50E1
MTRYKLKELKNTSLHEEKIQQAVQMKIQQRKPKRFVHITLITALISTAIIIFVMNQLNPEQNRLQATETPTLLNIFHEIDGTGVAYSENFREQDMQHIRSLRYYREIPLTDFLNKSGVTFPNLPQPYVRENGTVIAVNDGFFTELQFHFKSENHFLNISIAPSWINPVNVEELQQNLVDAAGNPLEIEQINDSTAIVKQKINNGSGLVYRNYFYNEKSDAINVMTSSANEYYSYHNGLIYHIGYSETAPVDEQLMDEFVKDFIVNNEIRTLNLEEATIEDNWLNRGGKTMLICLLISIVSFSILHVLLKNASKKSTKIIWSIVWVVLHTPILTWLVSFSTGILYGNGFAVAGMLLISFPLLLIIGLCIILPNNRTFRGQLMLLHILIYLFTFSCSLYDEVNRPSSTEQIEKSLK